MKGVSKQRVVLTSKNVNVAPDYWGNVNDLVIGEYSYVVIPGTTGSTWHLTGIAGGVNGQEVIIENDTGQAMITDNESIGSSAANRIKGAVTVPNQRAVRLHYSGQISRWIISVN